MAVIKELKGLWGVMGTVREIADVLGRPMKSIREAVRIGLPSWDPPAEVEPSPPDQETVNRVREVIGMGTVEERRAFERVIGTWRKVITGAPRETPPEESPRALPPPRTPPEQGQSERGAQR